MVNVFIIHSGKDYQYVKNNVEPYLMGKKDNSGVAADLECNANILTLQSGKQSNWKKDARKKIKMAQVVIVVIGSDSSEASKTDTMGWEVRQAFKRNKQIMMINRASYAIPEYMYIIDRFTSQKKVVAKQQSLKEIKKRIDDYANGRYHIFSQQYESMKLDDQLAQKSELVDQYKMFQRSSEDLVSRRQSVNSFYISVNSALVSLVGIVIGLTDMPTKFYALLFMCITGIILDFSWFQILDSYGILNAAKMKVINMLEEQLPVTLYEAEWNVMSDKLNNKKYVSFTSSEKRVPIVFALIYLIIASVASCILFL